MTQAQLKRLTYLWAAVVVSLVLLLSSCRSSRNLSIQQDTKETANKKKVDSLLQVVKEKDEQRLKEVTQAKAAGVQFRDRPVYIPVTDDVTRDSLIKINAALRGNLEAMKNEVELLADGSIKAKGDILSANTSSLQKDREISRLREKVDSLQRYQRIDTTGTKQTKIDIDDKTKRGGSSLWSWIIVFLSGAVVGAVAWHNRPGIIRFFTKNSNMKSIIFFFLTCLFLTSCGTAGNPDDNISIGTALAHCAGTLSWWAWLIGALAVSAGVGYFFLYKGYKKYQDWPGGYTIVLFVLVAIILLAFLMRPAEIAANTTFEQAARGVFIGY